MSKFRLENVRRVLRRPSLLLGEFNHQATRLDAFLHKGFLGTAGVDVMEEDWDNLLILDGCRYDVFEERNSLPGGLRRVRSRGSQSLEFMRQNFEGRTYHDTVYVSANPYTTRLTAGTFHDIWELFTDHWDHEYETVLPETVTDATVRAHEEHEDKRLVAHFMQPHIPFIGEMGQKLSHTGLAHESLDVYGDDGQKRYPVWSNLRYGFTDIDEESVWEAYRENLDIVLSHVEELCEELPGKTVITSDHGNLFGERLTPIPVKGYGHPAGIRIPELVDVPWLVIEGERREVCSDPPLRRTDSDDDIVQERLEDLGYKT